VLELPELAAPLEAPVEDAPDVVANEVPVEPWIEVVEQAASASARQPTVVRSMKVLPTAPVRSASYLVRQEAYVPEVTRARCCRAQLAGGRSTAISRERRRSVGGGVGRRLAPEVSRAQSSPASENGAPVVLVENRPRTSPGGSMWAVPRLPRMEGHA
jgi:hypothetical protein